MKTIRRVYFIITGSILIGWMAGGCSHNPDGPSPDTTCRIQQYVSRSVSSDFTSLNQTDYEYDQRGNLSKLITTYDKRPVSGTVTSQTGTTTVTYLYDADGYLTASSSQQKLTTLFGAKTTVEQVSVATSYSYANGKLTNTQMRKIGAYGVNTSAVESYEYSSSGELVRKTAQNTYDYDPAVATEIPSSPTGPVQIWTYQQNLLTDYVEKNGSSEYRPILLQNGVVTKIMVPGSQGDYSASYEYDSQQRPVKMNEYIGGTLTRAYTQTWSDAKPSSATLPAFKGWPVLVRQMGREGVLSTNTSSYLNTITRQIQVFTEQTSITQTNSQGFVTNNTITLTYANPAAAPQNTVTTETYIYSGCQ